ncbi:MAG: exodeoxyribonuclease VII small subunit [Deltaproteobacteria bacterium]|nr:exodeoxyribonuclease VII small subunit [Deltaproteobacteria bacterium]
MAKQTFEKAMENLETIVQELESGDLSLEKSMKRFEEGILTANADGNVNEVPFHAHGDTDADV